MRLWQEFWGVRATGTGQDLGDGVGVIDPLRRGRVA